MRCLSSRRSRWGFRDILVIGTALRDGRDFSADDIAHSTPSR
jgi:hypothetical protein